MTREQLDDVVCFLYSQAVGLQRDPCLVYASEAGYYGTEQRINAEATAKRRAENERMAESYKEAARMLIAVAYDKGEK